MNTVPAYGVRPSALISGFSAGPEMITARQFGYGKIYGVEVDSIYMERNQAFFFRTIILFPDPSFPREVSHPEIHHDI